MYNRLHDNFPPDSVDMQTANWTLFFENIKPTVFIFYTAEK